MARPYKRVRDLMRRYDDTLESLSAALGCSATHLSMVLNNRAEWRVNEMYFILERYQVPFEEMHLMFPPNGSNEYYDFKPVQTSKFRNLKRCGR